METWPKQTPGDSGERILSLAVYRVEEIRTGFSDWTSAKQLVSGEDGQEYLWLEKAPVGKIEQKTLKATEMGYLRGLERQPDRLYE